MTRAGWCPANPSPSPQADAATVNEMLKDGRYVLANTLDKDRRSGLHYAAGRGSDDCIKMLVEAGSDPNEQDKDKYTPLHIAAGCALLGESAGQELCALKPPTSRCAAGP